MIGMRILLVTGGRDLSPQPEYLAKLQTTIDEFRPTHLYHGGATGADRMCAQWVMKYRPDIMVVEFPADWSQGPSAGPRRNRKMVDTAINWADLDHCYVLAFPGGRGTKSMVDYSISRGLHGTRMR